MGTVRSKAIITALIVIFTVVSVIMLIRPGSDGQEVEDNTTPGVLFENVALVGSDKGVRSWELAAGTLRPEKDRIYLDKVDRLVLLEDGEPKYYVYAGSGVWSPRENKLRLQGGVVVEDRTGFQLTVEELVWNSQDGLLDFVGNITVTVKQGGNGNE